MQNKLDALATVTANLYHENQALKQDRTRRTRQALAALPAPG